MQHVPVLGEDMLNQPIRVIHQHDRAMVPEIAYVLEHIHRRRIAEVFLKEAKDARLRIACIIQ